MQQNSLNDESSWQGIDVDEDKDVVVEERFPVPRSVSSRALVPYTPKSEVEDLNLQELVHFYGTVLKETVTSPGPRREWFPFTVTNAAFFHAVIGSTASLLAYAKKAEADNVEYFYHRGQAISLVNKAISAGEAATEDVFATVACFIQQDSYSGASLETKQHMDGLVQLAKLLGGLTSPVITGRTRRLAFLGDLSSSIVLNQKPKLEPILADPDISSYFQQPSRYTLDNARAFGMRVYNFTERQDLSDVCVNVYWGLRNVTEFLESNQVRDLHDDDLQFTDRVEVLERATHPLWYSDTKDPNTLVFRLFGSATLIYIYTRLRMLPAELRILKLVALRMKDQMERASNLNVLLATFPELMLWVLFLGGQAAEPERKPFFARQASKILIMRKIEEEQDIVKAAQNFLWPERNQVVEVDDSYDEDLEVGSMVGGSSATASTSSS